MSHEGYEKFEAWLIHMDDALAVFARHFAGSTEAWLDYSPNALASLEAWLLSKYSDVQSIKSSQESEVLDGASRFLGEIFRKNLDGKWFIDFSDPKNIYFGLPQLRGMQGQKTQFCPITVVTAALDRRNGVYFDGIFNRLSARLIN
jgi:hypothetical protein